MATQNTRPDVYQIITDRLISLLEQGTAPWHKAWSSSGLPMNIISGKRYSGVNFFMLASAASGALGYMSFKLTERLRW